MENDDYFEVIFVITDSNGSVTEISELVYGDADEYMKTHFPEWKEIVDKTSCEPGPTASV